MQYIVISLLDIRYWYTNGVIVDHVWTTWRLKRSLPIPVKMVIILFLILNNASQYFQYIYKNVKSVKSNDNILIIMSICEDYKKVIAMPDGLSKIRRYDCSSVFNCSFTFWTYCTNLFYCTTLHYALTSILSFFRTEQK